jgi:uncharacterized membrane protein
MKKLLFLWGELKSTFWFIPVLIIVSAVGLAVGLIYIDSVTDVGHEKLGIYLIASSTESARSILSVISAAMIGVAGTVFSLTLVALSLASTQFGSRLLKNFMYAPVNQVVIGTYVSTFVFCLIVLNSIKGTDDLDFVPSFSVMFSIVAAVANILLLIIFIHHTAVSIQADNVISNISRSISKNVKALFPEELGQEHVEEEKQDESELKARLMYKTSIPVKKNGYLQYVDGDSFLEFATKHKALIELLHRPGDYLVEGMDMAVIHSKKEIGKKELKRCNSYFITGYIRTPQQDTEYLIHQMVEIACRALSPGINDPFTAIACIDNLTSTMCHLAGVKFPSRYRYDDEKDLKLITRPLTYEGLLDAAFNQIRQNGKSVPAVMIRLIEALIVIHGFVKTQEQIQGIRKHTRMIISSAERTFEEPNDLEDLKERSKLIFGSR